MKPRVYIETTIVSYLAARPSNNIIRAARQRITQQWWNGQRGDHELVASELTIAEASAGHPAAAARRLRYVEPLPLVDITDAATALAESLLRSGAIPAVADRDALHVAVCAITPSRSADMEFQTSRQRGDAR